MKNYLINIFSFLIGCFLLLSSCQKGKLDESFIDFSRLKITPLHDLDYRKLQYNGRFFYPDFGYGTYLIPYDKNKDSIDVKFYNINNEEVNQTRLEIKEKNNNYFVHYNNPTDSLLVFSRDYPITKQDVPNGYFLAKISNQNKRLSPNNEPIHLAFYKFKEPYNRFRDVYEPPYLQDPVDTLFNITKDFSTVFVPVKKTPSGYRYLIAKILTANKKELLINGRRVYLFLGYQGEISELVIPNEGFSDKDENSKRMTPFVDAAMAISTKVFLFYPN